MLFAFFNFLGVFMKNTIKLNREFRRCYARGKCAVNGCIVIYAIKNSRNNKENRFGLTAGKTIGNAVKRNRAKRLMRVAFYTTKEQQITGFDLIIVARSRISGKKADAVISDFRGALKKLELLKNEENIT